MTRAAGPERPLERVTLTRVSPSMSSRLGPPLAVAAGAVVLAPTLLRPGGHGPVLCPMRRITGVWCPTCGMTRAIGWLAHGDLHQALRYHPLAPLFIIEAALLGGFWFYRRQTGRDLLPRVTRSPSFRQGLLVTNALLVLLVWVIRLKSGAFDDLG